VTLEGRGLFPDQTWEVEIAGKDSVRKDFTVRLPEKLRSARHVFAVTSVDGDAIDGSDAFLAVDIGP